jgi:hypothetical protein
MAVDDRSPVQPAPWRLRGDAVLDFSHLRRQRAFHDRGPLHLGSPKELASMQWQSTPQAQVRVNAPQLKLHAQFPTARRCMRLSFVGAALSSRGNVANSFVARGTARVSVTPAAIDLIAEADLQALGFHGSRRTYICADLNITIGPP